MNPGNQKRSLDALKLMIETEKLDFDVRYYAEKAVKFIEEGGDDVDMS